uniref:ShKT domain-containing protein n=1 Tax=Globodera pallida TaxID=36090 RepID=A0A183C2F1_GLOPA
MCHQPIDDNPSGALPVDNWAFASGVNGQLNGLGGSFCTDFEPNCASFRQFCFLQSIAEACLWSCGICGGFGGYGGGIAGGFGQFGKKRR